MQFTATRSLLHNALQTVTRAVSGRSTLPILANIHFAATADTVTLAATDLELGIRASFPATVQTPGTITVPAKTSSEIVSQLPEGDVSLEVDDRNTAVLKARRSTYKILGLPAEEYPPLPEVGNEVAFQIKQAELYKMIRSVLIACPTDDTRPILTGVRTALSGSRLTMVSTDTHRLALRYCEVEAPEGERAVIIPGRALTEVLRVLEAGSGLLVTVRFDANQVLFDLNSVALMSRLVEGVFPKFERVIPSSHTTRLLVPVADFLQATKRASIVAKEGGNRLTLRAEGEMLNLDAQAGTVGNAHEEFEIDREGDEIEAVLNYRYLIDTLGVVESDRVAVEMTKPLAPIVLREDGDEKAMHVIMPMQIE